MNDILTDMILYKKVTQCWIILFVGNAFNGVTTNGSQHLEHQQMVHDEMMK